MIDVLILSAEILSSFCLSQIFFKILYFSWTSIKYNHVSNYIAIYSLYSCYLLHSYLRATNSAFFSLNTSHFFKLNNLFCRVKLIFLFLLKVADIYLFSLTSSIYICLSSQIAFQWLTFQIFLFILCCLSQLYPPFIHFSL